MKGRFLFLGTGSSTGVPMICCHCPVCTSTDPRNKRLRPSGLLFIDEKIFLIDAGPDLRQQALSAHINHLDGVLLTHTHFDHVAGLDELRIFYIMQKKELPVLLSESSLEDLQRRYDYLFKEKSESVSLTAQFDFIKFQKERGAVEFQGVKFQYMSYEQGGMKVAGFRVGPFAYVSDIKHYPETIFEDLQGVQILVLSALRKESSAMHFSLEEAGDFAKKVRAEMTFLTHISHRIDHEKTSLGLPQGMFLGYDGLNVEFFENG